MFQLGGAPRLHWDTAGAGPGAGAAGPFVGAGTPRRVGEERSCTPEPGVRTSSSGRTAVTVRPATTPPPTQSEKADAALPFPHLGLLLVMHQWR
jgi:hypothetical protein